VILFALFFLGLGFLLALLLPWRWVAAVGAAFAVSEWILAVLRGHRDDGYEGLALVAVSGLFALAFLALWLLGIALALALRRRAGARA